MMACGCQEQPQQPRQEEAKYEVKLPGGMTEIVTGEHNAKVAVTRAGGGTYSRL